MELIHCFLHASQQFRIGITLPKRELKRENLYLSLRIDGREIPCEVAYFDKDPSAKADVTQYYELDILHNGNARAFVFGSIEYTGR